MHYHIDPLENSTKYNKIFDPEPYLEIFYKEYYKGCPNGGPTISSFCNFDKTIKHCDCWDCQGIKWGIFEEIKKDEEIDLFIYFK